MSNIDWTRATRYFLLQDFIKGFGLGMKYFFRPKATLNYPHEKGPLSPRYRCDQLMRIGWKVFLPMSLGWVVIVAFFAHFGVPGYARWAIGG